MANSQLVQSLLRGLDIIEQVARAPSGLALDDISNRTGLRKSTAHNLIRTLCSRGYLQRDHSRCYRMGGALPELWRQRYRQGVFRRAERVVRRLHEGYPGATINFCELVGQEIGCRLRMSADCPGAMRRPQGHTLSAFGSATGLCLQAFNASFRHALEAPGIFEESGQRAWSTRAAFDAAVGETARRGVAAIQVGDRWRLAAPVSDLFALGLQVQMDPEQSGVVIAALRAGAAEIEADGEALAAGNHVKQEEIADET
ncbi:MAG: helix-turn-helix domain-containing protein [Candidatus Marinimicrobia bacterium]|nr:helix-turn-helix domain-containing protein [Candidatus Neomarinimicrobiota bacterium]